MKTTNQFIKHSERPSLALLFFWASFQFGFGQTTITPIPTLGGSAFAATAINSAGQVAGFSRTAGDTAQHAFLFSGGALSDLGTLGGSFSLASAINDSGAVIGDASTAADLEFHAFMLTSGGMTDLGTLGGSSSTAVALNNLGQVVGNSFLLGDLQYRAFLYQGGSLANLGTLGGSFSSATAINALGQVVGDSAIAADVGTHAFLYQTGVMLDIGTLGGTDSYALDINDAGQVVGESFTASNLETHAFLFQGGTRLDLGTLGGTFSTAAAINNAGQIIGDASIANDTEYHAFIFQNGAMTDLGTLGGTYSTAAALNNHGQVVGDASNAGEVTLPFLWSAGVMRDLNTLLPPNSGWELWSAALINDAGQIVGYGSFEGTFSWFLMTPGSGNRPPLANAGPDQSVECGTVVLLDGSSSQDPDGDTLAFEWREGAALLGTTAKLSVTLALGAHPITLTVTDPHGASSQDTMVVAVVDTTPPLVTCPAPVTLLIGENCQAVVPDLRGAAKYSDNCTSQANLAFTQIPAPGAVVGPGTHSVNLTITDEAGNAGKCAVQLTVTDQTPPVIQSLTPSRNTLWPANRELIAVAVAATATDNCGAAPVCRITAITSSEPVTGPGDNTTPDWQITGPLTCLLRAERSSKDGRIYTITVECRDSGGNVTLGKVTVAVDKDKNPKP